LRSHPPQPIPAPAELTPPIDGVSDFLTVVRPALVDELLDIYTDVVAALPATLALLVVASVATEPRSIRWLSFVVGGVLFASTLG